MDYPRVTEILKYFTNYDQVPKQTLEKASARGTSVHALCSGMAKGAWIPDAMIGEELIGYILSFKMWSQAQVLEFIIIEKRYTDEDLGFCGQPDFVIKGTDGKLYLVDLKTSSRPQKTYPLQMAAYKRLLKVHGIEVEGVMLVYLNKDGQFPDVDLLENIDEETQVFISALHCWNYFNKGKKNGKRKRIIEEKCA